MKKEGRLAVQVGNLAMEPKNSENNGRADGPEQVNYLLQARQSPVIKYYDKIQSEEILLVVRIDSLPSTH